MMKMNHYTNNPCATGLCGDQLLDISITGRSLASQTLGKVAQTNYANWNNTQHNQKKPNETKLALV